ncbi:unnamed protein product [Anisakis simplex]|uniref:Integrase n=1 Tax=Anisakis simplex TaxID=6269 RepID=A0A0M3JJF9_ANISI|nr:unnamed protein product [Anisakis simplex]
MRITGLPLRYISFVKGGFTQKLGVRAASTAPK